MAEDAYGVAASADGYLPLRASENIQGNILAPFNKPSQRFLFISFRNQRAEARYWLGQLAGAVASTRQVVVHGETRDTTKETRHWVGVSFTSSGLVVLDSDLAQDLVTFDAFWQGPEADRMVGEAWMMSPAIIGDVDQGQPEDWVVGGLGRYRVDALLTVAADDDEQLESAAEDERVRAVTCGLTVLSWQDCKRRPGPGDKYGIEPFGFRDGISQPGIRGFTKSSVEDKHLVAADQPGSSVIATGEFVLGYDGEGGSYPAFRRPSVPDWMRDGSFQVFLRLRQDVEGWRGEMARLSALTAPVSAASTAIGRTPEGAPLAAPGKGGDYNDFTFEDDFVGTRTPRFAHIRKMNPRDGTLDDRTHRLLRRGIPFAKPLHDVTSSSGEEIGADGEFDHGLAFNAFMASIENQFEFLQRHWASSPKSPGTLAEDGPDPLIGASSDPGALRRTFGDEPIQFGRFVSTSGAVYAFAPSLSALRLLAGLTGGA
jgi:Dyp-type peroxidase family